MNCQSCGAILDPAALACPYCAAPTAAATEAHEREAQAASVRAQQEAAASARSKAAAQALLDGLARQSVWWSVAGVFVCCLPLGVVGIVQGVRARGLAAQAGVPVPPAAKAALFVGALSCVLSVTFVTWSILRSDRLEVQARARIAALEAQTRAGASAASLDAPTACGLAEIYALENGFSGQTGHELEHFECTGKLDAATDRATLDAFRFHKGSTRYETNVCLERGAKWFVKDLRKDACGGGASPALPPAQGRPKAKQGRLDVVFLSSRWA